jgi:hypothetical protein
VNARLIHPSDTTNLNLLQAFSNAHPHLLIYMSAEPQKETFILENIKPLPGNSFL